MSDLAEAVVRGDILVDEIDVIQAVRNGRLTENDGARFSAILGQYTKSQASTTAVLLSEAISINSHDSPEDCLVSNQDPIPSSTEWDHVLVDEVDFIKAFKSGRISKDDSHLTRINKELLEETSGDVEEAKISFHDDISAKEDNASDASSTDVLI
ncbi:unnamed protein product [Thelazia callipaeda]|uniref:DNA helicase n=1 Tax=Thelazia callipaeda TaxID=103827 RepID=A0A0N5DAW5_THECL|nr:unnamed protein product [Thelazia callipaeda]